MSDEKVSASVPWRKSPPTVDDVKKYSWWWNKPANGHKPFILQLDIDDDQIIDISLVGRVVKTSTIFAPDDWPGEWAPAIPPPSKGT